MLGHFRPVCVNRIGMFRFMLIRLTPKETETR